MYEELVKSLRAQADYYCCHMGINSPPAMTFVEAADAIEDLDNRLNLHRQGKIGHWIPVTERLPNNQCNVLCDDEGRVVVGYYTDEEVGWHDMHSYKIYPTHWMPLPEPPEEDKDGAE